MLIANKPSVLKWEEVQTWMLISGSSFTVYRRVTGILMVQHVSRMHAVYIITNWATGIGTKAQHPKPCMGKKRPQKEKLEHRAVVASQGRCTQAECEQTDRRGKWENKGKYS